MVGHNVTCGSGRKALNMSLIYIAGVDSAGQHETL